MNRIFQSSRRTIQFQLTAVDFPSTTNQTTSTYQWRPHPNCPSGTMHKIPASSDPSYPARYAFTLASVNEERPHQGIKHQIPNHSDSLATHGSRSIGSAAFLGGLHHGYSRVPSSLQADFSSGREKWPVRDDPVLLRLLASHANPVAAAFFRGV